MGQILLPFIGVRGNGNLLVKASSKSSTTTSAKASLSQSCHGHAQRVEAANPCALRFKLAMKPLTYPWMAEESNWPKLEQRLRVLAVYWFHWFYVLQRDETTATHKVPKIAIPGVPVGKVKTFGSVDPSSFVLRGWPFSIDDMTFSSWQTYQPYCVFFIHSHVKLQGKSWCPTAFPFKNHSIAMLKNPQGRSVTACRSHLGRWHDGGLERMLLEKLVPVEQRWSKSHYKLLHISLILSNIH